MCRYVVVLAVVLGFASTINASPSNHGEPLIGIPHIGDYNSLHYPYYGLQDLGIVYKGEVPSDVIKVTNVIGVKIPKPYPVKVPHNVPYPVHVNKPYPVPVTQIIKVPHPVPFEVVKKVQVPVEVPKPYPVPANEYKGTHAAYNLQEGADDYGSDHKQLAQAFSSTSYGEPTNSGYSYNSQQENVNSYPDQSQNVGQNDHAYGYSRVIEDGHVQNDGYHQQQQQQSGTH